MTDNLGRNDVDSIYKNLLFIPEELLISVQRKDIPFAGLENPQSLEGRQPTRHKSMGTIHSGIVPEAVWILVGNSTTKEKLKG